MASASYGEHIFLPPEQIFPVLLEDELRERGLDVQVLNASRGGLTARSAVRDLEEVAPDWKPDVVLVYHLSNDMDGLTTGLRDASAGNDPAAVIAAERAGAQLGASGRSQSTPGGDHWPTRKALATNLYSQAKNLVGARLAAARMLRNEVPIGLAEVFEARLEDAIHAARNLGAEPVIVTFATSHPVDHPSPLPAHYRRNLLRKNSVLSTHGWRTGVADWNKRLVRMAAAREATLIDLAPAIEGRSELFTDFVHFTPKGHAKVARTLAGQLAPILEQLAER